MNNFTLVVLFCSLLLVVSCIKQEKSIESEQSIQDIMADTPDFEDVAKDLIKTAPSEKNKTQNTTNVTAKQAANYSVEYKTNNETTPTIERKCRNSAILYGGCKWNEAAHKTFNIKIQSSSKQKIPGVWMIITGESGGIIYTKRTEDLLSGALRTYVLNYEDMKKEVGVVKRIEILPIENINGTEYACLNQRVYTIPEAYCKPSTIAVLNEDGTINQTG